MSDRGMKKWAPFASLIEQSEFLEAMYYEKNKKDKPKISSERAEEINRILTNYHGEVVIIQYFYDGYVYKIETILKRIDVLNRKLILEDGSIPFSALVDLSYKEF